LSVCAVLLLICANSALAAQTLSGWFVKTEMTVYSSRLKCTYYLFFPSGHVYFGNPPPGTSVEYSKLFAAHPENCGTYTLTGEKLTLKRNNGSAPEEHTYSPGAGGIMDSSPIAPVFYLADGTRLEGSWGIDTAISGTNYSVSASTTFKFHRDGSFEGSGHAGYDGRDATSSGSTNGKGTYEFKGGKVIIKYNDGTTKSPDAFGTHDKVKPWILVIDGIEYNNQ
jgi:hypothetical protein